MDLRFIWQERYESTMKTLKENIPNYSKSCYVRCYWNFAWTVRMTVVWCLFRMKMGDREVSCLLTSLTVVCLVVTPGSRACPHRCACYVPTEMHCTFRYLTSIPDGIPANVERINLGCVGLAWSPSQRGTTDHHGDLSPKHLWLLLLFFSSKMSS